MKLKARLKIKSESKYTPTLFGTKLKITLVQIAIWFTIILVCLIIPGIAFLISNKGWNADFLKSIVIPFYVFIIILFFYFLAEITLIILWKKTLIMALFKTKYSKVNTFNNEPTIADLIGYVLIIIFFVFITIITAFLYLIFHIIYVKKNECNVAEKLMNIIKVTKI